MKYVCVKSGKYKFNVNMAVRGCLAYDCVYLDEGKIYGIDKIREFKYNDETYSHTLTISGNSFLLTKHDMEYFRKPTISHYEVREFGSMDDMNSFLKEIHADDVREIIFVNGKFLVVWKIHGEI